MTISVARDLALVQRPGFQKLVASVCSGSIGAVFCIEASRLARNGRDWHHLIDLCALVGTLVIDPDGTYDPRLVNDRLLLGLKGTMSEYELSLLRQRGLAARDSKALRGELQFILPPGYCWNEIGQIEMDPDERIGGVIRLLFDKFQELGSARQVLLWAQDQATATAGHPPQQQQRVQDRVATGGLPHGADDPETSSLCRRLCVRPHDPAHADRRRSRAQDHRPFQADDRDGTYLCATIIPATSPGSSSKRTRS